MHKKKEVPWRHGKNELDQNTNSWTIIQNNNLQQKESKGKIGKISFDNK